MCCPPTPQVCLDFLPRSKTYLNERAPKLNRELSLSNKPVDAERLIYMDMHDKKV